MFTHMLFFASGGMYSMLEKGAIELFPKDQTANGRTAE